MKRPQEEIDLIHRNMAKAVGLIRAGVGIKRVALAMGYSGSGSLKHVTRKDGVMPKWWNEEYEDIANFWKEWAIEKVPEYYRSGKGKKTGAPPLKEKHLLCLPLSNFETRELLDDLKSGVPKTTIATRYSIGVRTVHRIASRAKEKGLL